MAEKKQEKTEQEYTIPLRGKFKHVARYKKTPKAIKSVKEFLARHMKIYDRDLNKIKLEREVNEFLWARGIKNPPHKIKVKAIKNGDIVNVELVDLPNKLKFKKLREEKQEKKALEIKEKKKSMMEKAKETMQGKKEDENKDGVANKKEVQEKKKAVEEAGEKQEKDLAKQQKHMVKEKSKQPKRPVRQAMKK